MAVEFDPRAVDAATNAYSPKKITLKGGSGGKLSYDSGDGRAFNLTINRSSEVNYAVYSRQSVGAKSGGGEVPAEHGGLGSDPMLLQAIKAYRDLILSQILGTGGWEGADAPPTETSPTGDDFVASLQIGEGLTISMDNVDTEYWSVENTAQRLVDFAKALIGEGDRQSNLGKVLDGIDQGFLAAKEAFGGALPDISQKTVDLAKKMLAEWTAGTATPAAA